MFRFTRLAALLAASTALLFLGAATASACERPAGPSGDVVVVVPAHVWAEGSVDADAGLFGDLDLNLLGGGLLNLHADGHAHVWAVAGAGAHI